MPFYSSHGHQPSQLFIVRIHSSTLFIVYHPWWFITPVHSHHINSTSLLDLMYRMKRSFGNSPSGITPLAKIHRSKQHSSSRGRKRLDFDPQQTSSTSVSSHNNGHDRKCNNRMEAGDLAAYQTQCKFSSILA